MMSSVHLYNVICSALTVEKRGALLCEEKHERERERGACLISTTTPTALVFFVQLSILRPVLGETFSCMTNFVSRTLRYVSQFEEIDNS